MNEITIKYIEDILNEDIDTIQKILTEYDRIINIYCLNDYFSLEYDSSYGSFNDYCSECLLSELIDEDILPEDLDEYLYVQVDFINKNIQCKYTNKNINNDNLSAYKVEIEKIAEKIGYKIEYELWN